MSSEKKTVNDSMELYTAPFSFEYGYIFDANNETFADMEHDEVFAARVRGWGRIGYYENAEKLQDEIGEHFAKALTEYWDKYAPKAGIEG